MQLSFIFPVHNEQECLEKQLDIFIKSISKKYKSFEIVLIENGSTDKSWQVIKKLKNKYSFVRALHLPNPSYGLAIRLGILNSLGKKIFILNVDYFDNIFIDQADKLLDNIDLVIGSKTLYGSLDQRSMLRRLGTYFFNVFLRLILNYPGTDTHGIKAFKRSKILIDLARTCRTQNELFDTELVLKLTKNGAIFVDLPQRVVELRKSRYFGFRRFFSSGADFISIVKTKYFSRKVFISTLVDADDYGFSKLVNQEILRGVDHQLIDIVSIMANLVDKKDLLMLKKRQSEVLFSLHFNVLRGKPITDKKIVPSLVDKTGNFYSLPFFLIRLFFGLISLAELKTEFLAQYKKLSDSGLIMRYLSSEQHLHIFSPISQLLEGAIVQTSIKKIRSKASSYNSLDGKFIRKTVLFLVDKLLGFRFGNFHNFKSRYDAYIVHPGA